MGFSGSPLATNCDFPCWGDRRYAEPVRPMDRNSEPIETALVRGQRWFWLGCALQAGLGVAGAFLVGLQGRSLEPLFRVDGRGLGLGLAAALPLFLFFHRLMTTPRGVFVPVRRFLEQTLRPVMRGWSLSQLACLALLAGVGEELLFRGAIQGWVSEKAGEAIGLLLASALFGLAHSVNRTYAITAGVMGGYLGLLAQVSGSLVCPMVTHALYDFLALVWLLRSGHPPLATPPDVSKSGASGDPIP